MDISVNLLPPFRKPGETGVYTIKLSSAISRPEDLGRLIEETLGDRLDYQLFDKRGCLTADFLVNGSHFMAGDVLDEQARVIVIPNICGG